MVKKILITLVALALGVALFLAGIHYKSTHNLGVNSTFTTSTDSYRNQTSDIWGTHIGTSTVGIGFPSPNVTSSVITKIGRNIRQATYQIKMISVTSTANNLSVTVQGSNDYLCDTSATSVSSTTDVVQTNINWYDAMTYETNRVHPTTFTNGSSTAIFDWANSTANSSNVIDLFNLNFECLRFRISGSSTLPYVGLSTK